jgi:hypothetical protein
MNKYWKENNGRYEFKFKPFYTENVILTFRQDNNDLNSFNYISSLLKVEDDYIYADSIEEAKEEFEYLIETFLEDQVRYYEDLLQKFQE